MTVEGARRATHADLDDLAWLADVAVDEQRHERGGEIWALRHVRFPPYRESFTADLDGGNLVVVGSVDDVSVGYAVSSIEELRDGRNLGVVDDVFVHPGARGVGVGEAMMALVDSWCRGCDCIGIDGFALPGNRATKNFFESFGYKARAIIVHHPLT